jgi:N12 class adenine-specific DNA methylase
LEDGKRVELIKTEKINGENVQISYIQECDAWFISSNNVSLLAASHSDLSMYREHRYSLVLLIADQWFSDAAKLTNEKLKQLKKLLIGYTAVG